MISISDLVSYVDKHPQRNKVFRGWSNNDLAVAIFKAYQSDTLRWCATPRGVLCGIVFGYPNYDTKTLHIQGIFADDKTVMARFMLEFMKKFGADWKLSGNRRNKLKTFKTKTLCILIH